MKAVICLVTILASGAVSDMAGECDMAQFYLELGCTAVQTADGCPEEFHCPEQVQDPTKCYYGGKAYEDRQMVPQTLVGNPCNQACSCRVAGGPQFECATVDCVETFDTDTKEQCIYVYELDSCCSTSTYCGKDQIARLATCEVDGKTYREGESFEPLNTRKSCVCAPGWNGTSDDPSFCRDIDCGLELHYADKLRDHCAPVFPSVQRGCPINFECPTANSTVVRGLNVRSGSSQCTFGNMTLAPGDEVIVQESCLQCSCQVPPLVSCVKSNSC